MKESVFQSRAQPDKLLGVPDNIKHDSLLTEYLAYECYRTRIDERFDINGNLSDQLQIIDWYLTTYLRHRKKKLPLSAMQIAFLNSPVPVLDLSRPISIISFSFIRRELGQHWNLNDRRVATEAIYWWCVEHSPTLRMQDALVPTYYIDTLNEVDTNQRWMRFHTNYFVCRYYQVHPELHFLNLDSQVDRAALIAYLIILCATQPHLVRFLPRESVGQMFAPLADMPSYMVLDSIFAAIDELQSPKSKETYAIEKQDNPQMADLDEDREARLLSARCLREKVISAIEVAGYSLRLGRRVEASLNGNSAVCYDAEKESIGPLLHGVALIGPLHAASGLGQASRISAQILQEFEQDISFRNFDMDNPAPVKSSSDFRSKSRVDRRSINIIHLNAESIPLAFAYLNQHVYKNSYNIGYFFWELSRIPTCHHLALKMLDEIWVSSEYNREIYSRYTDIPVVNVGMAVEPLNNLLSLPRSHFGLDQAGFVFLATFDSFSFVGRKNPLAVIQAFQAAFPSKRDVTLLIKTQNRFKVDDVYQQRLWAQISTYCAQDARLILFNETLSYAELLNLKALCDCYVSLHRSEGWGFGMLEAMQLGLPVIATGYSGNMEFCNAETCYLVDFDLFEPRPEEYIFVERGSQWAEPRIESAVECMRSVLADRTKAKAIAKYGQDFVESRYSVPAIAKRYQARLNDIDAICKERASISLSHNFDHGGHQESLSSKKSGHASISQSRAERRLSRASSS